MDKLKDIFQNNKRAILFASIFILVVILYQLIFSGSSTKTSTPAISPTAGGLVSELSVSPVDVAGGRELLSVLTELQSISLSGAIFTDTVFVSLKDWSSPLTPQPFAKSLGRRNPFSDNAR